jgi:predicted MFS family arabinose efflux permease
MLLLKIIVALVFAAFGAVLVMWQTKPTEDGKDTTSNAARYGTMVGVAIATGLFGFMMMHFGMPLKASDVKSADILGVTIPTANSALEAVIPAEGSENV